VSGEASAAPAGDRGAPGRRARAGVLYRRLVDGGILYDDLGERVHHLNSTASFVWERCVAGDREGTMVEDLCATYEVDAGRAREDIGGILAAFERAGLLQP
jgi:hypothetical protein